MAVSLGGILTAISPAGKYIWNVTIGAHTAYPAVIDAAGNVFFGAGRGTLLAYDGASGRLLWQLQVGSANFSSSPVIGVGGALLIGSVNGSMWALNATPGSPSPTTMPSISASPTLSRTPSRSPSASASASNATGSSHGGPRSYRTSTIEIVGISAGCVLLVGAATIATICYIRRRRAAAGGVSGGISSASAAGSINAGGLGASLLPVDPDDPSFLPQSKVARQSSVFRHDPTASVNELQKQNVFDT